MARQRNEQESGISLVESRAWELFAANITVGGQPSHTPQYLAQECFKAAAVFEAVAKQQNETKG